MSSRGRRSYSHLRRPMAPIAPGRNRSPPPLSEIDPVAELNRILGAKPQRFQLQFFAVAGDRSPSIVLESEVEAADASAAIRASAETDWPPRAIGLRILDREGRVIFERLRADR